MLVLVDGRQVFVGDYSRTIWDNLPVNIEDVRQIEVVKGASSSLFGSNAATGVINIITKSPLYDHGNVANVTVGTQNFASGDNTATFHGNNWGSKTTVGGLRSREFDSARAVGDADRFTSYHEYLTSDSVVQLNPKLQINTGVTYSKSRSNTPIKAIISPSAIKPPHAIPEK